MAESQTEVEKKEAASAEARAQADEASKKAAEGDKSRDQKKADAAQAKADDAEAEADMARSGPPVDGEPTTAVENKGLSAVAEPDRSVGDQHAQKFSNDPENPQLAAHLDPDAEGKVKMTMETSDTIAAGRPAVAYVHPEMVGDYERAGWSRAT